MSEKYDNTFPPEVWSAANGNPLDMINAWNVAWHREGAEDERERIIALLEEASEKWRDTDYDAHYGAEACLALIKGEKK